MNIRVTDLATFIEKSNIIHNNKYSYEKFTYVNQHVKSIITCKKHGDFLMNPNKHLSGNNCRACSIEAHTERQRFTTDIFIKKAKEIHGDRYDYSKVNYITARKKVTIICKKHGEFEQIAHSHLQGNDCNLCYRLNTRLNHETFIQEITKLNGHRHSFKDTTYKTIRDEIKVHCDIHNRDFTVVARHYLHCKNMDAMIVTKRLSWSQADLKEPTLRMLQERMERQFYMLLS